MSLNNYAWALQAPATEEPAESSGGYVASAAYRVPLDASAQRLGPGPLESGDVLWVRVTRANPAYDLLELANGESVPLRTGDTLIGVAGHRQALRGYVGSPPAHVAPGDPLELLSLGGILGRCTGGLLDLGLPTTVEVIDRMGRGDHPYRLRDHAIPSRTFLGPGCPVLAVVGTSMSAGKTRAAVEIVASAAAAGLKVAAVKLTGVACLRDILRMKERGAFAALSFLDAGLPSTVSQPEISSFAKGLLASLDEKSPDLIVAEMGDGLLGPYGVDHLLQDELLRKRIRGVVLSASDHVGAWGAAQLLKRWQLDLYLVTGPLTDSPEACRLVEQQLRVPAANACTDAARLFTALQPVIAS